MLALQVPQVTLDLQERKVLLAQQALKASKVFKVFRVKLVQPVQLAHKVNKVIQLLVLLDPQVLLLPLLVQLAQ